MSLEDLSKEELKDLVRIYARNMFALDGVWFQSVEQQDGMEAAMHHDRNAWRRFTETEARRIKKFLGLPDRAGLDGLEQALALRFPALANTGINMEREGNVLTYKVMDCRVQTARKRKGMAFHPCESAGIIEHRFFAKIIDDRIECETISCYPCVTDPDCACSWRFVLT